MFLAKRITKNLISDYARLVSFKSQWKYLFYILFLLHSVRGYSINKSINSNTAECTLSNIPKENSLNYFPYLYSKAFINSIDWVRLRKELPDVANHYCEALVNISNVNLLNSENQAVHKHPDRHSDFYNSNFNLAIINPELYQIIIKFSNNSNFNGNNSYLDYSFKRIASLFPFHMLIGASGYYDENYDKTLAAFLINLYFQKSSDSNTQEKTIYQTYESHFKEIIKLIFKSDSFFLAGGSTGVSGGGDLTSLLFKFFLIEYEVILNNINSQCNTKGTEKICQKWNNIESYLNDIIKLNIESKKNLDTVELQTNSILVSPLQLKIPKLTYQDFENQKNLNHLLNTIILKLITIKSESPKYETFR